MEGGKGRCPDGENIIQFHNCVIGVIQGRCQYLLFLVISNHRGFFEIK